MVGKQLEDEFKQLLTKRNEVIKSHVLDLKEELVAESPVDTGELRQSWNTPIQISKGWRITNHAPHAVIIDGGRRWEKTKLGNMKELGSVDLPDGYDPTVQASDKRLNAKLRAIK